VLTCVVCLEHPVAVSINPCDHHQVRGGGKGKGGGSGGGGGGGGVCGFEEGGVTCTWCACPCF
jgi:hypothetical protein